MHSDQLNDSKCFDFNNCEDIVRIKHFQKFKRPRPLQISGQLINQSKVENVYVQKMYMFITEKNKLYLISNNKNWLGTVWQTAHEKAQLMLPGNKSPALPNMSHFFKRRQTQILGKKLSRDF